MKCQPWSPLMLQDTDRALQREGCNAGVELRVFVLVFAVVGPTDEVLVLITVGAVTDEWFLYR